MAFEVTVSAFLNEHEVGILNSIGSFGFNNSNTKNKSIISNDSNFNFYDLKETSKKRQLHEIIKEHKLMASTWTYSEDQSYFVVKFFVYGAEVMDLVMEELRFKGFGSQLGTSIHVVESTAYFCDYMHKSYSDPELLEDKNNLFQKFINSVKSRMTVIQIYQSVKDRGEITFDYLCFLVTAAGIATISLSSNNYPGIVASMLLSPLMNPILALLFGIILRQKQLINEGIKNLAISLVISIVIGFTFGIACHFINFLEKNPYPTSLMMDRGQFVFLLSILLFAIVSAPNLSTALLSNNSSAQIGNAISLSLLPPLVNTGFLWLLSLISVITKTEIDTANGTICEYKWLRKDHKMIYFDDLCKLSLDFLCGGLFSFFITLSNIFVIMIVGYYVFKLKKLASYHLLQEDVRKFYDKDLKEAYSSATMKTLKAKDPNTMMLKEMVKEYAILQNKNVDNLTKTERNRLYGDLKDITQGVTEDIHFQNLSHSAGSKRLVNLPDKFNEMDVNQKMNSMELNNIDVNQISTMTGATRRNFLRQLPKYRDPVKHQTKFTSKLKKPSSVGRFEVYTNPELNPATSPSIVGDRLHVKFEMAE